MAGVKIIVRNNDGDLIELARYLNRGGWEVSQNAEEGEAATSTLSMDDVDESVWDTLGLNDGARRQIRLVDLTSNRIVQFGYTGRRNIKRRYDDYGSPVGRAWSIEIIDANTVINRRVLTHHGAKRPRETDLERIAWLITAHEWDIVDQFIIGTGTGHTMSKADYRGQMVNDVISDCAQQSRRNYWLDIVDDGAGDRLTFWYGRDNRDYYYSTLSISNDLADLDIDALSSGDETLVYPPSNDTEYQMDPSRIFTGVEVDWEKGKVYRHSVTGDTQYERWDTVIQAPNIHEKDRAVERALNMLERLADEDVRIESGILVPASQAHLVRAGMRIPVKLTHIPTMTDYVDCRILSRGLSPRGDGRLYWIPLTLEPIEATVAPPVTSCSTALGDVVGASQSDQLPLSVSMSITPGVQSFIVGAAIAANHNSPADHDMTISGGGTQLYSYGGTASPAFAVAYTDDASPVTMTGAYTGGFNYANDSTWASVMIAVDTNATTPVQDVHDDFPGTGSQIVTLALPPTAGNMIIMVVALRDSATTLDSSNLRPADGLWVTVATASAESNRTGGGTHPSDGLQLYARCVQSGESSDYGFAGASIGARVSAIEVAIT